MISTDVPYAEDSFEDVGHLMKQLDASIKSMQFMDACGQLDGLASLPEFVEGRLADWIPIIQSNMSSQMESCCQLLYTFCKLLGHCNIVDAYMPCALDISDAVIKRCCDFTQDTPWQCRYIHLLWCSCLVRLPFPLPRISPSIPQLIALSLQQLDTFGPEMHASSILLANYFNRPDVAMDHSIWDWRGTLAIFLEFIKLNPEKTEAGGGDQGSACHRQERHHQFHGQEIVDENMQACFGAGGRRCIEILYATTVRQGFPSINHAQFNGVGFGREMDSIKGMCIHDGD